MKLQTQVSLGLVAGVALGGLARLPALGMVATLVNWLEPVGTVFIRLITMVVVPLVAASLFTGVASLGDVRRLGRLGGRTLAYFLGTTVAAAVIGLALAVVTPRRRRARPVGARRHRQPLRLRRQLGQRAPRAPPPALCRRWSR